jgi:hypothetical protein
MWFRFAAIGLVLIAGCFVPLGPRTSPPLEWYVPMLILAFCPIAMVVVFGLQRVNPRSAKMWHRPSWISNPFNFRDPIQFFHFGAIITIAQGVVVLARVSLTSTPFYVEALVPLAMGLGMWIGVRVVMALYRSKFGNVTVQAVQGLDDKRSRSMSTPLDLVKQPKRVHFRRLLLVVTLGVVMFVVAVFWGSHSEGFHFLEGKIRTSQEIQTRVGVVRKVTLPVSGQFREKSVGSDKWVWMIVDVNGDKGAVTIRTALQKKNNVWKITESSVDDQKINLE